METKTLGTFFIGLFISPRQKLVEIVLTYFKSIGFSLSLRILRDLEIVKDIFSS